MKLAVNLFDVSKIGLTDNYANVLIAFFKLVSLISVLLFVVWLLIRTKEATEKMEDILSLSKEMAEEGLTKGGVSFINLIVVKSDNISSIIRRCIMPKGCLKEYHRLNGEFRMELEKLRDIITEDEKSADIDRFWSAINRYILTVNLYVNGIPLRETYTLSDIFDNLAKIWRR